VRVQSAEQAYGEDGAGGGGGGGVGQVMAPVTACRLCERATHL
jgi:hypothetical protein